MTNVNLERRNIISRANRIFNLYSSSLWEHHKCIQWIIGGLQRTTLRLNSNLYLCYILSLINIRWRYDHFKLNASKQLYIRNIKHIPYFQHTLVIKYKNVAEIWWYLMIFETGFYFINLYYVFMCDIIRYHLHT